MTEHTLKYSTLAKEVLYRLVLRHHAQSQVINYTLKKNSQFAIIRRLQLLKPVLQYVHQMLHVQLRMHAKVSMIICYTVHACVHVNMYVHVVLNIMKYSLPLPLSLPFPSLPLLLSLSLTHTHTSSCRQVGKQELNAPSHVVERYIELLCRYQPQDVYGFLHTNDNYRVEEALDVCNIYMYIAHYKPHNWKLSRVKNAHGIAAFCTSFSCE